MTQSATWRSRRQTFTVPGVRGALAVLRLDVVWFVLPGAFVFALAASVPIVHSDLFYMLMNGQLMAEGTFPVQSDPFTYAPADPLFFNQPWIAQLLLWAAAHLGGFPGLILVHAMVLTGAYVGAQWLARRAGASAAVAAFLTLLAFALGATNFTVRPQSFAPLVFVATLAVIRLSQPGQRRAIALMFGLSVLWANLHGSFFLGLGLAGAHLVGAVIESRSLTTPRVRHLTWLVVACGLGTLINPVGPMVWWYVWRAGMDPTNRQTVQEWLPPTLATLSGQIFFLSLPVVAVLLGLRRRWPRPTTILVLLAFGGLALMGQRAILWWGLLLPPLVGEHLAGFGGAPRRVVERPILNLVVMAFIATVVVLDLPWLRTTNPLLAPRLRRYLSEDHPTAAASFLQRQGVEGRLFARMEWGGYLEWMLWPRMRVFLDARIEQHPPAVWQDYFAILSAQPNWEALLDRYGADYLLLDRQAHVPLIAALTASPQWLEIYADDLAVAYERRR